MATDFAPTLAPSSAVTGLGPDVQRYAVAGFMMLIPLITICGNLLVIISVLRFKSLHSAINFLILGLAVADLFVALFVMPYAVYVHVVDGQWNLGTLMCDIYLASDVACSTSSIFLLAVISFDRYRAVSRPIQYSRQSQNIRRVIYILIGIWIISLVIASPIVFGINLRAKEDEKKSECRFNNAVFSISSSIVSFLIPCFIILFVYIRIIIALKQREKAARQRRLTNISQSSTGKIEQGDDGEEAGRIVAGPEEHEFGGSSTPRSSAEDSLSENGHVVTNDFVSEGYTTQSRKSSADGAGESSHTLPSSSVSFEKQQPPPVRPRHRKFMQLRQHSSRRRRRSFTFPEEQRKAERDADRESILPSIWRQLSRRSPRLFRSSTVATKGNSPMIIENPNDANRKLADIASPEERPTTALTETETLSASCPTRSECGDKLQNVLSFSRSTTVNSGELFDCTHDGVDASLVLGNTHAESSTSDREEKDLTVTFSETVQSMSNEKASQLKDEKKPRAKISVAEETVAVKILTQPQLPGDDPTVEAVVMGRESTKRDSGDKGNKRKLAMDKKQLNGGMALRIVKKTMKHEQSLKRKVSKNQRKEKRATKTLGVVVGVFLICWGPFFSINILSAICSLMEVNSCDISFDIFFVCTWIGYMNSFMNPVIYTIFNTEFRRAFKSILFGRERAHQSGRVHV